MAIPEFGVAQLIGYDLNDRESILDYRQNQEFFLYFRASRLVLLPTQSPVKWILGALFSDVAQLVTIHLSLMPRIRMHGVTPTALIHHHGVVHS
jgi:hypothetical protein